MHTKKHGSLPKKRIVLYAILIVVLLIVYLLADRYLIEHVEGVVVDSTVLDMTEDNTDGSVNDVDTAPAAEETDAIEYDDWNYKSSSVQINIQKVQKGSNQDMITYFVADVKLQNSSALRSAFAKNLYGRNIVETTSKIAADNDAILAVNGDYYGFRSNGILIRNGTLYRDQPARKDAAIYQDGAMKMIDETEVPSSTLLNDGVVQTLSFGPVLVQDGKVMSFSGKIAIDAWAIEGPNPRTGIGMISQNHFVFIVVDGRQKNYSRGMSLSEFASLFAELGCTEAYNLDGGGSATMYFMGRVVNRPSENNKERAISDILYIKEETNH